MIQCYSCSLHTYKMLNKLIQHGYKLFALAEHSYIWWFIWSSCKYSFKAEIILYSDFTVIGSMIYHLVKCLPKFSRVYLDNYFTSIPLFRLLYNKVYSLYKTTRSHSSGLEFPTLLKEIKQFYTISLSFHQLVAITVLNVLCLGW
jgi:hypothetical protein